MTSASFQKRGTTCGGWPPGAWANIILELSQWMPKQGKNENVEKNTKRKRRQKENKVATKDRISKKEWNEM